MSSRYSKSTRTSSGFSGKLIRKRSPDQINLKEIVLKLRATSTWSSDAGLSPSTVRILDCKVHPKDKRGLSQLVELNTPDGRINEIIERIRRNPDVIDASFSRAKRGGAIGKIDTHEIR
jgi:hypothetical protein